MTFREKILNREKVCGTHVTMTDSSIAEMMGYLGFDFLWIDLEHAYISLEQLYNHLNAAKAAGTATIVRVPWRDFTYTKKVMEMGPDGIIFPMIKDAKDAEEMIAYTLYPPRGNRGCGPKRATRFGLDDEMDYFKNGYTKTCRFIQIEQETAVEDLEEIVKNPYIDGYIFGLMDLSGSIGEIGDCLGENNLKLVKKTIDILNKHNKTIGVSITSNNEQLIKTYNDLGINMISAGADFDHILKGAMTTLKNARKVQAE